MLREDRHRHGDVEKSSRRSSRGLVCCIHGKPCAESASSSGYDSVNRALSLISSPSTGRHETDYENLASLQTLMKNAKIGGWTPARSPALCSVVTAAGDPSTIDADSGDIDGIPKTEVVALYKQYYLGIQSARQAERLVQDRSDFRLYHRIAHRSTLQNMRTSLRLYIVYLNCKDQYRHFPIVERPSGNGGGVYLVVNYGNPHPHRFGSLAALLRHYTTYAHVNQTSVEVFPDKEVYQM